MKAILEFDLPDEKEEFEEASKAGEMSVAIFKVRQIIRSRTKYCAPISDDEEQILNAILLAFGELGNQ